MTDATPSTTSPRILLIVSGGIAAYKSLELVRILRRHAIAVRAVMTKSAAEFVTPLSLSVMTEDHVYGHLFDLKDEREIGHIQLSRQAALVVVCPATANIMAKMATGIADDLATTLLLATDKPVLAVPAMNVRMWNHPATQRNLAALAADGVTIMPPDEGAMACGEFGPGRLPEPPEIAARICGMLGVAYQEALAQGRSPTTMPSAALRSPTPNPSPEAPVKVLLSRDPLEGEGGNGLDDQPAFAEDQHRPLYGKRVLVTAGPTHEPIDPVRYIANRSSGRQGFAIAAAAADLGAEVTLIAGPVALPTPAGVVRHDVESAREMLAAVEAALAPHAPIDCAIMVAAVADWRAADEAPQKMKKDGAPNSNPLPPLALAENPDILATVAKSAHRPRLLIGFAAETERVVEHALAKLTKKGCDWIVANDVSGAKGQSVMGGDANAVHIVRTQNWGGGVESWPEMPKEKVARRLVETIANAL